MSHTWKYTPHASHRMGEAYVDILTPAGTPRFYTCRRCKVCGGMQYESAAGQFIDTELTTACQH